MVDGLITIAVKILIPIITVFYEIQFAAIKAYFWIRYEVLFFYYFMQALIRKDEDEDVW